MKTHKIPLLKLLNITALAIIYFLINSTDLYSCCSFSSPTRDANTLCTLYQNHESAISRPTPRVSFRRSSPSPDRFGTKNRIMRETQVDSLEKNGHVLLFYDNYSAKIDKIIKKLVAKKLDLNEYDKAKYFLIPILNRIYNKNSASIEELITYEAIIMSLLKSIEKLKHECEANKRLQTNQDDLIRTIISHAKQKLFKSYFEAFFVDTGLDLTYSIEQSEDERTRAFLNRKKQILSQKSSKRKSILDMLGASST